jgi:hypothetical protein
VANRRTVTAGELCNILYRKKGGYRGSRGIIVQSGNKVFITAMPLAFAIKIHRFYMNSAYTNTRFAEDDRTHYLW